ncbi:MAG: cytochrome c4 [Proteobacteria bacterium]|nr:MAG: cytochrome c4 [Pseudomonadota bacterium]
MKQIVLVVLIIFTGQLMAQGDAEKGQALSATCMACHGTDGNSVNPIWPTIAGQHPQYSERQLKLFKNGDRPSATMMPMTMALSEQDMADLAAYFGQQEAKLLAADPAKIELGEAIYQGGIKDRDVPACLACHGPTGQGNPLSGYPVVANQHAAYMVNELNLFKQGRVVPGKDDVNGKIMADIAKYMTQEEIEAVASYMQGLQAAE